MKVELCDMCESRSDTCSLWMYHDFITDKYSQTIHRKSDGPWYSAHYDFQRLEPVLKAVFGGKRFCKSCAEKFYKKKKVRDFVMASIKIIEDVSDEDWFRRPIGPY